MKIALRRILLFSTLLIACHPLHAAEYYTIQEPRAKTQPVIELASHNFFVPANFSSLIKEMAASLLKWQAHHSPWAPPTNDYNRAKHFGGWALDPNHSCLNTRHQVLVRDSLAPVTMKEDNPCQVARGLWFDPYSRQALTDATVEVEVDHLVALKAAYSSGAYKWSRDQRCQYTNYTGASYHLISVSRLENRRKGDRNPAEYLPPNEEFVCDYLAQWLKVKLAWGLVIESSEAQAIHQEIENRKCAKDLFRMSIEELRKIREDQMSPRPCYSFKTDSQNL